MAMPRGGRPLVTLNWIPASCSRKTASVARFVSTFSCVTSVPSTSAITMRIGFADFPFLDAILSLSPDFHPDQEQLLLLVVPQQTAVHEERRSCDVVGFLRCQETSQPGNVFRFSKPSKRNISEQLFELDRVIQKFGIDRCFDRTRRNRVDRDSAWGKFDRQVSRQHLDSSFARAIGSKMRERQFLVHRTDVDDFSGAPCLPEMAHHRLRDKKHSLQIDVQNGVEIFFRHVPKVRSFLQTRVVDKNVDLSKSRDGLFNESLSVRDLSDIGLERSSPPLRSRNSTHYFVRPLLVLAIADGNVGPLLRQTFRNRPSNSLVTARNCGYFPCQPI